MNRAIPLGLILLLSSITVAADKPAFYAFDNCLKAGDPKAPLTIDQQLDLLKGLSYDGIAWRECDPAEAKKVAEGCKSRGMKMHTIYCAAQASPEGLKYSAKLKPIFEALKGQDTIIWLHIGGKGPEIASLKDDHKVIADLRELAEAAKASGLRIAIYPHVGEWTARFKDALAVAKLVDRKNFGVCFNLCHALALGDEKDIPTLLEQAAPLLFTVSINGADSGVAKPDWKLLIQNLGSGSYDVKIVLYKLRELKFTGPIGLQGYALPGAAKDNLGASMAAWKKLRE